MSKNKIQKTVISANNKISRYWVDLWHYRELLFILAWRDFSVRYKQTVIGILWAIIRPVLTALIFTMVFGRIARLPSDGVPYPLLVFTAMLPWNFFATSFVAISESLISNPNLISKVYFPRLIIPASPILVNIIDFLISFVLLIIMIFFYNLKPGWQIVFIPIFFIAAILVTYGVSTFIAALNIKYRDFRYVVPFLVQIGMYVSPVAYSSTIIPANFKLLYSLNPMVGIIDGFRWAVSGGRTTIYLPSVLLLIIETFLFLIIGLFFFRRMEKNFADII
jgi:lipopolysaccharide transport system permease protein